MSISGGRFERLDAQPARKHRFDQPLAVRPLLLDRLDVEPQSGQRFGEQFQILVRDRRIRLGVFVDLLLAQREELLGAAETEHFQCAGDLGAVVRQCREVGALGVIAEEGVEHLLHVAQIRLDFTGDLRQDQTFLRPPRHLVEDRRDGGIG